jgi:hypothetical protein
VPPTPTGRIDANNALAECVAIGDIESLAVPDPKAVAAKAAGPKFVVPNVPPVAGAQRPRSPSTPPMGLGSPPDRSKPTTQPPKLIPPPPPLVPPPKAPTPVGALSETMAAVGTLDDDDEPARITGSGSLSPGAFSETMPAVSIADLDAPDPSPLFSRTQTIRDTRQPPLAKSGETLDLDTAPHAPLEPLAEPAPGLPHGTPPPDHFPEAPGLPHGTPPPDHFPEAAPGLPHGTPPPDHFPEAPGLPHGTPPPDHFPEAAPGLPHGTPPPDHFPEAARPAASTPTQMTAPIVPPITPTQMASVAPPATPSSELTAIALPRTSTISAAAPPPPIPATQQLPTTLVPPAPSQAKIMAAVQPQTTPTQMAAVPPPPPTAQQPVVDDADAAAEPTGLQPVVITNRPMRDDPPAASPGLPHGTPPAAHYPDLAPTRMPPRIPTGAQPPLRATPAGPVPVATPPPVPRDTMLHGVKPPIVAEPRTVQQAVEVVEEATDLNVEIPVVQVPDELPRLRKTVLGVAVVPPGASVLPAVAKDPDDNRDTSLMSSQEPAAGTIGSVTVDPLAQTIRPDDPKLPTVEELTPSGDWTMTPGADGPTIAPRTSDPKLPTGDWLISLDHDAPDGWSEPSKVDKIVPVMPVAPPLVAPPPVAAAPVPPRSASPPKPIAAIEPARLEPMLMSEPKVQIDPTLIEPLTPMPVLIDEAAASGSHPMHAASSSNRMQFPPSQPMMPLPGQIFTPAPGTMANASASYPQLAAIPAPIDGGPSFFIEDQVDLRRSPDPTSLVTVERSRRRIVVIIVTAALAVAAGIVLLLLLTDKKDSTPTTNPAVTGSDEPVGSGRGSSAATILVDAAVAAVEVPVDAAVAAPVECFIDVTSVPPGADVVLDPDNVIGTTPAKLPLPCGAEAKVTIRKARFAYQVRTITPTPDGAKIKVVFAKLMYSVKVSSQPPGATITLNAKSMGFTPTVVKLPAFEVSWLTIGKDGYVADTQKITPKQNNQSVYSTLKKVPKRR